MSATRSLDTISGIDFVPRTYEKESLGDAIIDIQTGKIPFCFVNFFNREEKEILSSLSSNAMWGILKKIYPNSCYQPIGQNRSEEPLENEKRMKVKKIFERFFDQLGQNGYQEFLFITRGLKSNVWHTDAGRIPQEPKEEGLRLTVAFDSERPTTTQFFLPTQKECDEKFKDYESLDAEVREITNSAPNRIYEGEFSQACLFHTGTIHQGPSYDISTRILISINGGKTQPIPFPYCSDELEN